VKYKEASRREKEKYRSEKERKRERERERTREKEIKVGPSKRELSATSLNIVIAGSIREIRFFCAPPTFFFRFHGGIMDSPILWMRSLPRHS